MFELDELESMLGQKCVFIIKQDPKILWTGTLASVNPLAIAFKDVKQEKREHAAGFLLSELQDIITV